MSKLPLGGDTLLVALVIDRNLYTLSRLFPHPQAPPGGVGNDSPVPLPLPASRRIRVTRFINHYSHRAVGHRLCVFTSASPRYPASNSFSGRSGASRRGLFVEVETVADASAGVVPEDTGISSSSAVGQRKGDRGVMFDHTGGSRREAFHHVAPTRGKLNTVNPGATTVARRKRAPSAPVSSTSLTNAVLQQTRLETN